MLDLITAGCVRNTCTLVNPLRKQQDCFEFIHTWLPQAWGYVHTITCPVWYEQQLDRLEVVHAHRTSCRSGWPRGFGELNPRPHSSIFTSVSVDSSPHSHLFTSMVQIRVQTAPKCCTEPLRYVTLHFRDRRGAASLRYRNRAQITVLCEQKPYIRYGFRAGARAIPFGLVWTGELKGNKTKKNCIELQGLIIRFSCFIALSQGAKYEFFW